MNSVSGTGLYILSVVIAFVMTPILVRHLGDAGYGFWELLVGLIGYLGILDLGITPAIARNVAVAVGRADEEALRRVVRTGLLALIAAGVVGGVLLLAAAVRPDIVFGGRSAPLPTERLVICVGAASLLLSFSRAALTATLIGLQQNYLLNAARGLLAIASSVVVYAGLSSHVMDALLVVVSVNCLSLLAEAFVFGLRIRHVCGPAVFRLWNVAWRDGKSLLTFGVKSLGLMASTALTRQGALFVLSHAIGPVAVTQYVFAGRLVEYGQALSLAIGYPLAAHFATAFGRGGMDDAARTWLAATRAMHFIVFGVVLGVTWIGIPFLTRWLGPQYAAAARIPFYVLCAGMFVQAFATNSNRVLVSLDRHGRAALTAVVLSAGCLAVSGVLVAKFGLPGVAVGVSLFMAVQSMVELRLACRALGIATGSHLALAVARYGSPLALASLTYWAISRVAVPTSYPEIIRYALSGGLVYVAACWYLAVTRTERRAIAAAIRAGVIEVLKHRRVIR